MPQEGSGLNRSVRSAPLSLAANRATRATTELTVAGDRKMLWGGRRGNGNFVAASNPNFARF